MIKNYFLSVLFILFISCKEQNFTKSPNVILIITDDQGYGDLGINKNPILKTPNIDELSSESIVFNNFYVSPVCAPTRSSLMTGRYSLRTGVRDTYNGGAIMSTDEITIAELLQEKNYKTGIFGKWHLGDNYPSRPSDQGFDESVIHLSGGIGQVGDITNYYQKDKSYFDPILWKNNEKTKYEGYCSDVFTDEAINFIEQNSESAFFCYLSFNAPHTPLQVPDEFLEEYLDSNITDIYEDGKNPMTKKDIEDAKKIYAMISNIDYNVGKVLDKITELGIEEDTIIIFMTDNGPQQLRYNANLRGLKGTVYNGGIKVPFYFKYPKLQDSRKQINTLSAHIDLLPTLARLCDFEIPSDRTIDGFDMFSISEEKENRSFFSYWTRKSPELYNNISLIKNGFKLVGNTSYNASVNEFELFNLEKDYKESDNLVDVKTEIANELKSDLNKIHDELINSANIKNQPLIHIGFEQENPSILNRNDASGQRGIWSSNNVYGKWETYFNKGLYNIKAKFNDVQLNKNSKFIIELNQQVYSKSILSFDKEDFIELKNIRVDEGKYSLIPFLRNGNKNLLPFYLEIEKIN